MSPRLPVVRSILLAMVVAFGITTTWFTGAIWLFSMGERAAFVRGDYEQLHVRIDGEPVIVKTIAGTSQQFLSIDREPTAGNSYQILYPTYVSPASAESLVSSTAWTNRLVSVNDGGSPATYWYLVHDGRTNGRAYGVGYHSVTKRVVGYFGTEGFAERMPPRDAWFQVTGNAGLTYATPERTYYEPQWFSHPAMYLLANRKLWKIETRQRSVQPLVDCPNAEGIGWAWRTAAELPDASAQFPQQAAALAPRLLLVRTPDACLLVEPLSGNVQRYALPASLRSDTLAAIQLADDRLLLMGYQFSAAMGHSLVWLDPEGKKVAERRVVLDLPSRPSSEATLAVISAFAAPAPVWQVVMLIFLVLQRLSTGDADSVPSAIGQALAIAWPGLALVLAASAAGAVAAFRRQRRFGLPGAVGWAIAVFLFGVPGWIAYRFHRTWPVLEDCPACDQPAPRDREKCTECGARFPPPELKGLEVFA